MVSHSVTIPDPGVLWDRSLLNELSLPFKKVNMADTGILHEIDAMVDKLLASFASRLMFKASVKPNDEIRPPLPGFYALRGIVSC